MPQIKLHPRRPRAGRIVFWIAITLLAGCHRTPRVSIPLQENAGKQYAYAVSHREQSNLELISDKKRFLKTRAIAREHFNKVVEFFPGDQRFTALAKLEIIEMDAGLDFSRVEVSPRDLRAAITRFQDLAVEYPDFEFIQAKALYDQGMSYKRLKEFPKAQACFLQVRDKFQGSQNKDIRGLALIAGAYYNQTYTNE